MITPILVPQNKCHRLAGYSLIDAVIGIALLAILALGAIQSMQSLQVLLGKVEVHENQIFVRYTQDPWHGFD